MGLREQKKAKTRKMISDMATELFMKKGYANVTTAEIAAKAEVSVMTLFNYFPTKEALVFDDDDENEAKLIKLVVERRKGQSIVEALLEFGIAQVDLFKKEDKNYRAFMTFIDSTPELKSYSQQMWLRHEQALATVIRKEAKNKPTALEASAIAHFILDSFHRALNSTNQKASLRALFTLLQEGWLG